ncbi:hypothetical protein GC170_00485 [bacterium]|nr:hypothetical protein [bacterium]
MSTLIPENFEMVVPSEADAVLARESSRLLASHKLGTQTSIRLQLLDKGEPAEAMTLSSLVLRSDALSVSGHRRSGNSAPKTS